MALLFTVNTKAEDGGMQEIINKVGIRDEVKAWITGSGDTDLQCVTYVFRLPQPLVGQALGGRHQDEVEGGAFGGSS